MSIELSPPSGYRRLVVDPLTDRPYWRSISVNDARRMGLLPPEQDEDVADRP